MSEARRHSFKQLLLLSILFYFFTFFLSFNLILMLKRFGIITNYKIIVVPVFLCLVISIIIAYSILYSERVFNNTQIKYLVDYEFYKIIVAFVMINIFIGSIHLSPIWNLEQLKDSVSLQWNIFGISVAVFLVWHAFINKSITAIEAYSTNAEKSLIKQLIKEYEVEQKCKQISEMYHSVLMITINLIVLLVATVISFLSDNKASLFRENIVFFSFYCCTNTVIVLFISIINVLTRKKKQLIELSKSNINEIKVLENSFDSILERIEIINNDTTLSESEKLKKEKELVEMLIGDKLNSNNSDVTKDFDNDQL